MRVRGAFCEFPSKSENQGSGLDFRDFLQQVENFSKSVPKSQLNQARAIIAKVHAKRFRRRREPRYGSINKGFTELELQRFLRSVNSEKFGLLFKYQAYMGLRVGEVCRLQIGNIDFDKRELTIKSEKSSKMDSLIIPLDLFKETIGYIAKNEAPIKASNGYVFFKDNDNNHNKVCHLDSNYVRKVFREVLHEASLDQAYGTSEEIYSNHKPRPLYRLSTHSLRHYAITKFAKSTNGNVVLTSRFARHSNPATTMRYIAKDKTELYNNMDFAFNTSNLENIKRLASNLNK